MCSETSRRISFSNDLSPEDETPIDRRDTTLLESSSDFEFSICSGSIDHDSSLADDLFADGMILPVKVPETSSSPPNNQILRYDKLSTPIPSLPPLPCPSSTDENTNSKKEIMVLDSETEEKTQSNKSFWRLKRNRSLNCDISKSLCSLPLLLRSNSTGSSVPNPKQKPTSRKPSASSPPLSPPPPAAFSTANTYVYSLPNKLPPRKSYGGSKGNSNGHIRYSPVVNVPPPPYIAKGAANLLGLGSFLRSGREKSSRK